jgi:hypothetical protein
MAPCVHVDGANNSDWVNEVFTSLFSGSSLICVSNSPFTHRLNYTPPPWKSSKYLKIFKMAKIPDEADEYCLGRCLIRHCVHTLACYSRSPPETCSQRLFNLMYQNIAEKV